MSTSTAQQTNFANCIVMVEGLGMNRSYMGEEMLVVKHTDENLYCVGMPDMREGWEFFGSGLRVISLKHPTLSYRVISWHPATDQAGKYLRAHRHILKTCKREGKWKESARLAVRMMEELLSLPEEARR